MWAWMADSCCKWNFAPSSAYKNYCRGCTTVSFSKVVTTVVGLCHLESNYHIFLNIKCSRIMPVSHINNTICLQMDEDEERRKRRREKNKVAAARCRNKKKERTDFLQRVSS